MNLRRFSCLLIVFSFVTTIARGSEWQTDYEQALATAKAAKKCVLLDFTGSDWCGPCIQMKKGRFLEGGVLELCEEEPGARRGRLSAESKTLPEKVTKQNERLLHQYGIDNSGFPTVILLNPDGKILGQLEGYGGERPADIIAWVEKLRGKSS